MTTPSQPTGPNAPQPGVCIPWSERRQELSPIQGDPAQFEAIWQDVDSLAYTYIWQLLVSF